MIFSCLFTFCVGEGIEDKFWSIELKKCRIFWSFSQLSIFTYLGALYLCVVERYFHQELPHIYNRVFTKSRFSLIMLLGWITCLLISITMNCTIQFAQNKQIAIFLFGALHCILLPLSIPLLVMILMLKLCARKATHSNTTEIGQNKSMQRICSYNGKDGHLITKQYMKVIRDEETSQYANIYLIMVIGYVATLTLSLVFLFLVWFKVDKPVWFWYVYLCVDTARLSLNAIGPILTLSLFWSTRNIMPIYRGLHIQTEVFSTRLWGTTKWRQWYRWTYMVSSSKHNAQTGSYNLIISFLIQ